MKLKKMYFILFLSCSVASFCVHGCSDAQKIDGKPTISDAERAVATIQVQNTFSKHALLISDHEIEFKQIWVSPDGPYAETVSWTNAQGIWCGYEDLYDYYVRAFNDNQYATLNEIRKLYPEIENSPENKGIGTWGVNTPTNPIIEIAGDGKTAKGMWTSNGPTLEPRVENGKLVVEGSWYWRKYAVDFVKENGQWKIWHMNIVYDISHPLDSSFGMDYTKLWEAQKAEEAAKAQKEASSDQKDAFSFSLPSPTKVNPNPYVQWNPLRPITFEPKAPEPYYTFSETFSY